MKKILKIVLSIISLTIIKKSTQGVDYQCVTADDKCLDFVNQFISFRASALTGSANGNQIRFLDIFLGTNTNSLNIGMDI